MSDDVDGTEDGPEDGPEDVSDALNGLPPILPTMEDPVYGQLRERALRAVDWHQFSDDEAQDIAQSVAVSFARSWGWRLDTFDRGAITRYALGGVAREQRHRLRRRDKEVSKHETFDMRREQAIRTWTSPEEAFRARELDQVLAHALNAMSAEMRHDVLRAREDGDSYAAIAKERGVTKEAVKKNIRLALRRLRTALFPYLKGDR